MKRGERFNMVSDDDALKRRAERFKTELDNPNPKEGDKRDGKRLGRRRLTGRIGRRGGRGGRGFAASEGRDRRGPRRTNIRRGGRQDNRRGTGRFRGGRRGRGRRND